MSGRVDYTWSILILSAAFFCVFFGFNTAQSLETTVVDKELADISLTVLYGCFTVMSVFAPRIVSLLGPKMAMVVGAIPYALLVFSNLRPSYYLSIPAFGLVGLSASLLWTGQGVYLGRSAMRHAASFGETPENVASRFNGLFFAAFQFNGAAGLLVASTIQRALGPERWQEANRYVFLSFGVFAALGCLVFLLLRPAPTLASDAAAADASEQETLLWTDPAAGLAGGSGAGGGAGSSINDLEDGEDRAAADGGRRVAVAAEKSVSLYDTLRLVAASRPMQFMIPIILYNGMSLSFMFGDYAGFFASQTDKAHQLLDKSMVGYVLATFYIVNSVASYVFGRLASRVGRRVLMLVATGAHLLFWALLGIFMYVVKLHPEGDATYAVVFLLAAIFAVGDSVWESQAPAVLQSPSFFPDEQDRDAAMSNLKMWQSLGFAVQFALGFLVPFYWIKLIILGALQLLAALALFVLDRSVRSLDAADTAND